MPTANIELPDGTKVAIDGSPEEIARVLALYQQPRGGGSSPPPHEPAHRSSGGKSHKAGRSDAGARSRNGIMQQLRSLIAEGFFDARQTLENARAKLEEHGHIYAQNQISTPLRRLVVSRELRRLRDGDNWIYVIAR
jgi:hypothetical protein